MDPDAARDADRGPGGIRRAGAGELNATATLHVVIRVWSKGNIDQIGIDHSTSDGTVTYSAP